MPTPWQRELANIFTPMRWRLDLYWNEIHRDSMLRPELVSEFADWLLSGDPTEDSGLFDSDFLVGDFDRDIACHSWIFLGTGLLVVCCIGDGGGGAIPGALPALAIAHALACLDADADLYAALNRVMEQVANQARSNASYEATTMRTLAASLQGRGKGDHIKLAALFKSLRKAHHHPGERRGTSQEIDDMEQALARIKSPPRSKRALDTLYDAANLIE
jgi:hypothetical protein